MIKSSVLNFVRQKADEAKQLAELHDTLKTIADNGTAIAAEEQKLSRLQQERLARAKDLDAANDRLKGLQEQATQLERSRESMNATMNLALGAANERAAKIIADADTAAKGAINDANARLVSKQGDLAKLTAAIDKASGDLISLHAEHKELERAHAELQRKHDALMAGLAALKPNL